VTQQGQGIFADDRANSSGVGHKSARTHYVKKAKWLLGASALAASVPALSAPLILNNATAPTVVNATAGQGLNKRAVYRNAGTVNGANVDLVATIVTTTNNLNHIFNTSAAVNASGVPIPRPQISSAGVDDIFVRWDIYQAGTYNVTTNSGGVPVVADVHVQYNDLDGSNNERAFVPVCSGGVQWVRIDANATTGRAFGTVAGRAEIFSVIGDQPYNSTPESGVEVFYPNTSSFLMGRTAQNGFNLALNSPTYSQFDTLDYECADFKPPVAVNDSKEGVANTPTVIDILRNDVAATANNNPPANNSQRESEYARSSVSLVAPSGATGITTDAKGDVTGFTVPGQGTWSYDDTTGALTFTPLPTFVGNATTIDYTYTSGLGIRSNAATVTVWYPGIGVTKSSTFNDTNGDGFGQVGETVSYIYQVRSYGAEPLRNVTISETGFTGAGTAPVPTYQSGDTNSDGRLDLTETWIYTATYTLVAADLSGTGVSNSATGGGETAAGTRVTDVSDSANPGNGNGTGTSGPGPGNDDPTITAIARKPITATNDTQPATIATNAGAANAYNVFGNDSLNGVAASPSNVTLTVTSAASNPGVALDTSTGIVSVAPGTPAGNYQIQYQICEIGNPTNCATATANITVTGPAPSVVPNVCMLATRIELNGGFENPVFPQPSPQANLVADSLVPGWTTNDSLGQIEIWDSGFLNVPSDSGDQFAELNANSPGTLVQTGTVNSRAELIVSWAHRARQGTDTATALISDNAGTSVTTGNFTATTSAWVANSQTMIAGAGANQFSMAFRAVSTGSGSISVGNFLDSISACQTNITSNNVVTTQTDTNGDGRVNVGDTITYRQTISNPAGNARPLTGVAINDTLTGNGNIVTPISGDTDNDGQLDPGESWTYDIVYTLTAADIAAGQVVTTSHATGNTGSNTIRSDDVTITTPFPIYATNDTQTGTIFAGTGIANAYNVFSNDLLRGAAPSASNTTLSVITPASNPGVTLDTSTGIVSVASGTPAGTYTIGYRICETGNPSNCADAVATIVVTNAPIAATNDSVPAVNGATGNPNAFNAFDNDRLNGVPFAPSAIVATVTSPATPIIAGSLVPVLDTATGQVSVPAGTPAGNYTIGYQICEAANPSNCQDATITVMVSAAPIAATADTRTGVNGASGEPNALNLFNGDTLNGVAATPSNTTLRVAAGSTLPPQLSFNAATGVVGVNAGTPAGTYSFEYIICETLNPGNCATATASVTVDPSPIVASSDTASGINGATGATAVVNAFTSDTVNGVAASPSNATLSVAPTSSVPAGLTFNESTGDVSVAPGTAAGRYSFDYQICESLNPANCRTATITVDVVAAPLTAAADTRSGVNGATGEPNALNLFNGDVLNGAPATASNTTLDIAPGSTLPPQLAFDPRTGVVGVRPGTPAGTYSFEYQICETLNPTNCQTATASVTVDPSPIVASNDVASGINGASGATAVVNAFTSDTVNGVAASPSNAILSITAGTQLPAGLTFNTDTGSVDVAAGTPAGTYVINYTLCERLNPTNCRNATMTVTVDAAPIAAAPDAPAPVNGATGNPSVVNAFTNDTLNGVPVTPATIVATVATPASNPGVVLNPATGVVSVAPGTPAGTYTIAYEICERLNPTNCATSSVTVVVEAAPIAAATDTPPPVNGATGNPSVVNAFANDTLNGVPVTPATIVATVKTPATNPGVVLDPATGIVSVAPGTPAGTYTITYEICERLNPTNCATSSVTVSVEAAPIAASTDTPAPVNGANGGDDVINVFTNDTLNGVPVTPATIVATVATPATPINGGPVPVLDPATGFVDFPAGTPAGTYTITYEICERLNPSNCATSTVTIAVQAPAIAASNDVIGPVNGRDGSNDAINAFTNDVLNGVAVDPARITATVTAPATSINGGPVPIMDPATGLVDVPANTPAGTYTIGYQICETLNPTNCANAEITVTVAAAPIAAATDTVAPVRSGVGSPNAVNAYANDVLNGVAVIPSQIIGTVLTPASNPGVVMDPVTGIVSVDPSVPEGTYTIQYQICEALNPSNCSVSTITIPVSRPQGGISGTVYTDLDGDRAIDSNEPRLAGWVVEIVRNGVVVATARTDAQGNYSVAGLDSGGGYSVRFRNPDTNVLYEEIPSITVGNTTTVVDQNMPIDPSGVFYDSVTRAPLAGVTVQLVNAAGVPLPTACFADASQASQTTGRDGGYRFDIIPGAAAACPAGETEYRIAVVSAPAGYSTGASTVLPPSATPLDPTGRGAPVRVSDSASPPTGSSPLYYLNFRLASGDPDVINNHIALDPFLTRTPLIVTKTSVKRSANIGDVVPYEITVRNTENAQRAGIEVVDILPPGMKYVMGTATVNGVPQEPTKTDRTVTWKDQIIPANGSVRYNLTLVVGAGVTGGEKVNTGLAQVDVTDTPVSNRATAVVTITPSAVFDCSELLGKVFEDADRDGYQDANEPGVPGVRLVTVNGQLITTDAFGRYHIACAAVPDARIGSNFVLKLDSRTLPLGWDVTTDNPRSIRLTRGKFGELNFGVAPKEDSSTPPGDTSANRKEKGE
jgi:large repetitive protein